MSAFLSREPLPISAPSRWGSRRERAAWRAPAAQVGRRVARRAWGRAACPAALPERRRVAWRATAPGLAALRALEWEVPDYPPAAPVLVVLLRAAWQREESEWAERPRAAAREPAPSHRAAGRRRAA